MSSGKFVCPEHLLPALALSRAFSHKRFGVTAGLVIDSYDFERITDRPTRESRTTRYFALKAFGVGEKEEDWLRPRMDGGSRDC
jgi:hypothetical protein